MASTLRSYVVASAVAASVATIGAAACSPSPSPVVGAAADLLIVNGKVYTALGIIASMQPMHVALADMSSRHPSGPWPNNLGVDRAMRAWQWKSIRDAGARITFGSDWSVASLTPDGMKDITVLSRDILTAPPRAPGDVVVDTTIFDGKVVYRLSAAGR
jgi:predicted amidohydrolase YtcJ